MGLETQLHKVDPRLRAKYLRNRPLIDQFKRQGHLLREQVKQDPVRHGHLLSREMHAIEMEVAKALCPGLAADNARERQKAMYWVLNQDWGKDLRASPYDKRYYFGGQNDTPGRG